MSVLGWLAATHRRRILGSSLLSSIDRVQAAARRVVRVRSLTALAQTPLHRISVLPEDKAADA